MIEDYAAVSAAPVLTGTTVTAVRPGGGGYVVQTDQGSWHARTVVVADRRDDRRRRAGRLAAQVPHRHHDADRRGLPQPRPASATAACWSSAPRRSGVQIAEELQRSGRPVTLAVGEHVRMPRTYRGRDILWWMDASGLLDERYDEVPDLRPGAQPAVDAAGRLAAADDARPRTRCAGSGCGWSAGSPAIRDGTAQFSGSLPNVCALADLKLDRLLDTIDAWADAGRGRRRPTRRSGSRRPRCPRPPAVGATCGAARSRRSSGRPATAPTCPGSTSPCSTARAGSCHDGGVTPRPRACT